MNAINTFEVAYTATVTTLPSKYMLNELVSLCWSTDRETVVSRKATAYLLSMQAILGSMIAIECDRETMFMKQQLLQVRTSVEAELRRRWSPTLLAYTR